MQQDSEVSFFSLLRFKVYNKNNNKKSFRLSDTELDSLILLIPNEIRTKENSGIFEYPSFSAPTQFPSDLGFKTDFNKILLISTNFREMPWENLTIEKKKKLFGKNLDMLGKFVEISYEDRKLRVEKAEQANKTQRTEQEKKAKRAEQEPPQIDENNYSSDCDGQIVEKVKKFVYRYGPLWFCSDHGFCFLKKTLKSSDDLCNWNFKETVLNYVNFSRILHALALCNPTLYGSADEDSRKQDITENQVVAKKLFDSIRQSSDYSFVSDWSLVRSLNRYAEEFNSTNALDLYTRTQDLSEALSEFMNIHPIPVKFRSGLKQKEDHVYNLNDPKILEAIKNPEVYYELSLGIYRVLVLQFIRALLEPGRLVFCTKCKKPYLRDANVVLQGGNRCPECKGDVKKIESP